MVKNIRPSGFYLFSRPNYKRFFYTLEHIYKCILELENNVWAQTILEHYILMCLRDYIFLKGGIWNLGTLFYEALGVKSVIAGVLKLLHLRTPCVPLELFLYP